jgi:hypothetical protein
MAVFDEQYVMSNLSPNNQRPFRDPLELPYAPYTDQSMLGNDYYTGEIDEDSEFYNPYFNKYSNIKNTISKYAKPVMGSIVGGLMGIPGLGYLMNNLPSDPYAKNRIGMYGVGKSSAGFNVDKFGYNLGTTLMKNRYMEPGTNSYRSYALQGLRSLDKEKANDYYQKTYGKSYDEVKSDIQNKDDPFDSGSVIDMGTDYQGGGDNENNDFNAGAVGNNAGGQQLGSGMSTGQHAAFRGNKGGRVGYFFGGLAARGMKR